MNTQYTKLPDLGMFDPSNSYVNTRYNDNEHGKEHELNITKKKIKMQVQIIMFLSILGNLFLVFILSWVESLKTVILNRLI